MNQIADLLSASNIALDVEAPTKARLFEVAGEAIAKVTGPVRIVCNSDLDPQDLVTAAAAHLEHFQVSLDSTRFPKISGLDRTKSPVILGRK